MKQVTKNPKALRPHPKNSRVHSDAQLADIVRSIREFGFIRPVVVDEHDVILAGHGAVLAAVEAGLDKIPVHVISHLSDRQKRAYVIADNKLALESTWNFEMLSEELSALSEMDFDLSITGFDEQELDALLKDDASILPAGFETTSSSGGGIGVGVGREVPVQQEGELIPLGSGVAKSPIDIPKIVFGKYLIPLTAEEAEGLEKLIKQYVEEHGTTAGMFARYWHDDVGDRDD